MSQTWHGDAPPPAPRRIGPLGWLLVGLRGAALLALLGVGLVVLLLLRLLEWPLFGAARPLTGHIPVWVSRAALAILGLKWRVVGAAQGMRGARPGVLVSNHASWLDIFALNAAGPVFFVAKSEVAAWPFIGWLARATGTLFIRRDPRAARAQVAALGERLELGQRLLFFPEGTSSDGMRVLPFRSTLFDAILNHHMKSGPDLFVHPVTLLWRAPAGQDARFYGWWGDMDLAPHLLQVLARPRQGSVTLIAHAPVRVADFADRKALARACERIVASGISPACP